MIPSKEEVEIALKKKHGLNLQKKLSTACIAVCGLGGLGSNIATALVRAGIGKLILIDFDHVDISNINRQQYKVSQIGMLKTKAIYENLLEISPYAELEIHSVKITENNAAELLSGADIICEAFDHAEEKAMLINTVLEEMPDKYLIAGSGMAGLGTANSIKTRKVAAHFYLCGDEVSEADENISLVSSRVMLCAAHQAHTAIRILADKFEV